MIYALARILAWAGGIYADDSGDSGSDSGDSDSGGSDSGGSDSGASDFSVVSSSDDSDSSGTGRRRRARNAMLVQPGDVPDPNAISTDDYRAIPPR